MWGESSRFMKIPLVINIINETSCGLPLRHLALRALLISSHFPCISATLRPIKFSICSAIPTCFHAYLGALLEAVISRFAGIDADRDASEERQGTGRG